jgi:hypothetical protein
MLQLSALLGVERGAVFEFTAVGIAVECGATGAKGLRSEEV